MHQSPLNRAASSSRSLLGLIACAWLLGAAPAAWADFTGPVIAILDGDTIDVLVSNKPVRVRFAQIDAPEKRQAFGTRSRQALSALVFRQVVTVIEDGHDRYGRVIGTVYASTTNINREMVRQGMAWVYRQYATDKSLFKLEEEARAAKRGLWADPTSLPPWEFRRHKELIK